MDNPANAPASLIKEAFPSWKLLPDSQLRDHLLRWSQTWNLNVNWCRDHALVVLRRWLFNKGLQKSFVHPDDPAVNPFLHPPKAQTLRWDNPDEPTPGKPNNWLTRVWTSTSEEALKGGFENDYRKENWHNNLGVSRELLTWLVFDADEPPRFVFEDFANAGWNFLDESVTGFGRRTELSFREYLAAKEILRLAKINQDVAALGHRITAEQFNTESLWRDRQLTHFLSMFSRLYRPNGTS